MGAVLALVEVQDEKVKGELLTMTEGCAEPSLRKVLCAAVAGEVDHAVLAAAIEAHRPSGN